MTSAKKEISSLQPTSWNALIVDDEAVFRNMLARTLKELNIASDETDNVKDALRLVSANHYDLVLVDIRLDTVNQDRKEGLVAIIDIKKARPELPVIAISAYYSEKDQDHVLDAGANVFVPKSHDPDHLRKVVKGILGLFDKGGEGSVLRYADVVFYRNSRTFVRGRLTVMLPRIQANILAYFMRHAGDVVKPTELYAAAWPGGAGANRQNRVYDEVCYLRGKLMQGGGVNLIHTSYAAGYVFA